MFLYATEKVQTHHLHPSSIFFSQYALSALPYEETVTALEFQ